jgi:phosphate transport system substrate-binding protein
MSISYKLTRRLALTVAVALWLLGADGLVSWGQTPTHPEIVSLHGAGSTFAAPLYKKWIDEFVALRPLVSISYDVVGSGEGVRRFLADAVDFAGSDEILSDNESAKAGGAIMVPVTAGMVVIACNVPGVNGGIQLPRDIYVDIFASVIRQWDDPRIKAANPAIIFPHHEIEIVAREDGSGTTAAFTRHLDAISSTWRAKGMQVGKLINWSKNTMLARGNEGVASKIQTVAGSIGYVEFWYAQRFGLRPAALQNKAGNSSHRRLSQANLPCPGESPWLNSLARRSPTR